jgi:hypothetical protein
MTLVRLPLWCLPSPPVTLLPQRWWLLLLRQLQPVSLPVMTLLPSHPARMFIIPLSR